MDVEESKLATNSLFSGQNSLDTRAQQRSLHSLTCSSKVGWLQQLVSKVDQPGEGEERAMSAREATILDAFEPSLRPRTVIS